MLFWSCSQCCFWSTRIRIFREYERGVVFTLGRFWQVKGPGLVIIIPIIQQAVRVDLRTVVLEVPTQDVISRDNVSVKVSAVRLLARHRSAEGDHPGRRFLNATSQLAQTMLRSVLGKHLLDEMLAEREKLNLDIQQASTRRPTRGGSRSRTSRSSRSISPNR